MVRKRNVVRSIWEIVSYSELQVLLSLIGYVLSLGQEVKNQKNNTPLVLVELPIRPVAIYLEEKDMCKLLRSEETSLLYEL